jgi:hypothetical protein
MLVRPCSPSMRTEKPTPPNRRLLLHSLPPKIRREPETSIPRTPPLGCAEVNRYPENRNFGFRQVVACLPTSGLWGSIHASMSPTPSAGHRGRSFHVPIPKHQRCMDIDRPARSALAAFGDVASVSAHKAVRNPQRHSLRDVASAPARQPHVNVVPASLLD